MAAAVPCTAAILRCRPDGSELRRFAWGLRNAFGLGFSPDGRLLATEQGADDRGCRPVGRCPDFLFEVREGAWYGWPDFAGAVPLTDPRFRPARGPQPRFLLANHDQLPPPERPLAVFPVNSCACKFDFLPVGGGGVRLILALFGDEKPMTAPHGPRQGRSVVSVDFDGGGVRPLVSEGLERPIDVAVDPGRDWLYVLDFGRFEMQSAGRFQARPGSGGVFRLRLNTVHGATSETPEARP